MNGSSNSELYEGGDKVSIAGMMCKLKLVNFVNFNHDIDMRRDGRVRLVRMLVDCSFNIDVLDKSYLSWRDRRRTVALSGVVKVLACVEDWERFGVDGLADYGNKIVAKRDEMPVSGFEVLEAAQGVLTRLGEESFVHHQADFWL